MEQRPVVPDVVGPGGVPGENSRFDPPDRFPDIPDLVPGHVDGRCCYVQDRDVAPAARGQFTCQRGGAAADVDERRIGPDPQPVEGFQRRPGEGLIPASLLGPLSLIDRLPMLTRFHDPCLGPLRPNKKAARGRTVFLLPIDKADQNASTYASLPTNPIFSTCA